MIGTNLNTTNRAGAVSSKATGLLMGAIYRGAPLILALAIFPARSMTPNEALTLVRDWATAVRDPHLCGTLVVSPRGDIDGKSTGAYFRYRAPSGPLVVSALVRYNIQLHSKYPDTWEKLLRAGQREEATLGEGSFELVGGPFYGLEADVVLLSKHYAQLPPSARQFELEVEWLLTAATHWRTIRYNRVMQGLEAQLIREGEELNRRMRKERPRPW